VSYETLQFEVRDGVAHITLDRPEAANSIDLRMGKELLQASIACGSDPSVRAVLLSARGKVFCAGGDLGSFASSGGDVGALLQELTTYLHGALSRLARLDAPVVAAVGGVAAGAGFSLAAACDLVIVSDKARFTMAYTKAGLTPDGSSTYYLPRLIGMRRTQELMLTNRMLSAQEALDWGIATRVVPGDELAAEAEKLAVELAQGPTKAFGGVKKLLLASANESFETQMENESQWIAGMSGTPDGQEGIAAFLAKREPKFSGR